MYKTYVDQLNNEVYNFKLAFYSKTRILFGAETESF